MSSIKKTDHFYLVDGSGYIFRAYYALPPLSRKSDGLPTGAVSGFCSMLFKLLEDARSDDSKNKPTHFAVIFDSARKNFRNEIYSEYKGNRSDAPDDLIPQFEYIRKSVKAFNLPSIELINYEADDLIATYVKLAEKDPNIFLISGDVEQEMDEYKNKFPNRYLNIGLCEQTMISMAAGMASEGMRPVVYSITPFLIERPFEQIKLDIDQQNVNVKLVGFADYPTLGPSHSELNAKKLMSLFRNIQSFFPKDGDFNFIFFNLFKIF